MVDPKCAVYFVCQRCLQPIKLDTSFNNLGEHTLADLSLPIHSTPDIDLESQAGSLDRYVAAFRLTESGNGANGFTLVGGDGEYECLSHQMRMQTGLFDIMSNNSEIDHPLCEECTDTIMDMKDQQLRDTEEEYNIYSAFHKKLEEQNEEEDIEALEKELQEVMEEEKELMECLAALKETGKKVTEEFAKQQHEKVKLEAEEERYLKEYLRHQRELMITDDEFKSLNCQLAYAESQLDKLRKTNVFNATFHIWHKEHFGTINNFRLGRLPTVPVEWSEINAAWGQTALLLNSLARKINLTFKRYRIVPNGNHSYIEDLTEHKEYPLYGSGGIKFLWDKNFDNGMVAFLDCLQQFKEEVEKDDSQFILPYQMGKEKIEDAASGNSYSIKIALNSEEQWTKALKFVLTNLKWGLAFVSSQFLKDESESASRT